MMALLLSCVASSDVALEKEGSISGDLIDDLFHQRMQAGMECMSRGDVECVYNIFLYEVAPALLARSPLGSALMYRYLENRHGAYRLDEYTLQRLLQDESGYDVWLEQSAAPWVPAESITCDPAMTGFLAGKCLFAHSMEDFAAGALYADWAVLEQASAGLAPGDTRDHRVHLPPALVRATDPYGSELGLSLHIFTMRCEARLRLQAGAGATLSELLCTAHDTYDFLCGPNEHLHHQLLCWLEQEGWAQRFAVEGRWRQSLARPL